MSERLRKQNSLAAATEGSAPGFWLQSRGQVQESSGLTRTLVPALTVQQSSSERAASLHWASASWSVQ